MSTHDKQGRAYAKLSELKAGDIVTVDGDFDCMEPWGQYEVKDCPRGLYIACRGDEHLLKDDMNIDEGYITGVYKGEVKP